MCVINDHYTLRIIISSALAYNKYFQYFFSGYSYVFNSVVVTFRDVFYLKYVVYRHLIYLLKNFSIKKTISNPLYL